MHVQGGVKITLLSSLVSVYQLRCDGNELPA